MVNVAVVGNHLALDGWPLDDPWRGRKRRRARAGAGADSRRLLRLPADDADVFPVYIDRGGGALPLPLHIAGANAFGWRTSGGGPDSLPLNAADPQIVLYDLLRRGGAPGLLHDSHVTDPDGTGRPAPRAFYGLDVSLPQDQLAGVGATGAFSHEGRDTRLAIPIPVALPVPVHDSDVYILVVSHGSGSASGSIIIRSTIRRIVIAAAAAAAAAIREVAGTRPAAVPVGHWDCRSVDLVMSAAPE